MSPSWGGGAGDVNNLCWSGLEHQNRPDGIIGKRAGGGAAGLRTHRFLVVGGNTNITVGQGGDKY